MKALWYGMSAFVIVAAGCDPGPADPAISFPRITASYVLNPTPGGNVDSVGCGLYEAYEFGPHFLTPDADSNQVDFFVSGAARPQCGHLDFLQTTAPGGDTAHFSYILVEPGAWEWWIRRMRVELAPYDFVQTTMAIDSILLDVRHDTGFSAPTLEGFDLTAFAFRHTADSSGLVPGGFDSTTVFDVPAVDAAAHLWGKFPAPTGLTPSLVGSNQPRLNWTNHHPGRSIDSTEIFRNDNGAGWQFRARVIGDSTAWKDTLLAAGTYGYFIRHVTSRTFPNAEEDRLARPTSPTTDSLGVAINPLQAPSSLNCTGATSTTASCTWSNGEAAESVIVERQNGTAWPQVAALAAGTTQHTDTGLHATMTYSYRVRHRDGPLSSLPSAFDNATTLSPPPPVALACVGSWGTWITCTWTNTVPSDSTHVFRGGVLRARLGPGVTGWTDDPVTHGSTYVYQVRHVDLTVAGSLGPPDTTVANQPGPDNLSCGRTDSTTSATCVWMNTDVNDSLEIQRKSGKTWVTRARLFKGTSQFDDTGLTPHVIYVYRVRYYLDGRTAYSLWSNEDAVGETGPEPYRPQGGP